ncbi:MAG TPA: thiaminase II [Pseudonocardia sp.]|jgi:thiaminase/transcriptional activator TenA|uniref:thiaminase II n=1 Tax=Pseudonocardia sp. TaxID=60912 RepID=UPI002EDB08CC
MTDTLSGLLWSRIEHIYQGVLAHPFVTGLTDGSLPPESFRHYIVQDAHYLRGYARALAVCAAKAPTEHDTVMFAEHAAGAVAAEQQMHAELMAELGSSPVDAAAEPVAPTTRAYLSYLLATVYGGSFAEGLGAVLPCYLIYARVGEELLTRSSPNKVYAQWIAMYGGEEFKAVVDSVLALTDRLGGELSAAELDRMSEHFVTTSRYEWMFWDAGYRRETWPI